MNKGNKEPKTPLVVIFCGSIIALMVAFVFLLIPMSFSKQAQNEPAQSLIYSEAKAQADASGDAGLIQGNMAEWADDVIKKADATPLKPRVTTDVIIPADAPSVTCGWTLDSSTHKPVFKITLSSHLP